MLRTFPALLSKAIDWASDLEAAALESGKELDDSQRIDARLAGVKEPARIRLLIQPAVPVPDDEVLAAANSQVGFITADSPGLTVGYAVFVKEGVPDERRVLVHEFVHVGQYERMGGIEGFLEEYLSELINVGYDHAPLETEAANRCNAILGPERG